MRKSVTARALVSLRADVAAIPRLRVLAAGKAAAGMAAAVEEVFGSRVARGVLTRFAHGVGGRLPPSRATLGSYRHHDRCLRLEVRRQVWRR